VQFIEIRIIAEPPLPSMFLEFNISFLCADMPKPKRIKNLVKSVSRTPGIQHNTSTFDNYVGNYFQATHEQRITEPTQPKTQPRQLKPNLGSLKPSLHNLNSLHLNLHNLDSLNLNLHNPKLNLYNLDNPKLNLHKLHN